MTLRKIFMLLAVVLLASCTSYKSVPYLQNSDEINPDYATLQPYDARIMPKDLLTITVNTTDPQAAAPFNLTVQSPLNANSAGNLYTGHFVKTIGMSGAEIQFGSPFTARPIALNGWFQYTPGKVDYYGSKTPSTALVKKDSTDICAIYIALTDTLYTVNTSEGNFVDYANDPHIIAYGEVPVKECVKTSGWKGFTIDLEYRDLTRIPKYIIVVASASKYGDYFTGSTGSLMYLDDFSLVYDGEPILKEKEPEQEQE